MAKVSFPVAMPFWGTAMRAAFVILSVVLVGGAPFALGQQGGSPLYKVDLVETSTRDAERNGRNVKMVTLRFTITRQGQQTEEVGKEYKIWIFEEKTKVAEVDVPRAKRSEDLSAILALDISGSMADGGRMDQARAAASVFFQKVPAKAELGLILFNHDVKPVVPLTHNRQRLAEEIIKAQPGGGTAYHDATIEGVKMLRGVKHKGKAVVIMTDGRDLNSKASLEKAIREAQQAKVKVYTVGIGEKGRQEKVTSVLVLDTSGSMKLPASDTEKKTKIDALKEAANLFLRFVRETNPPIVRTSVLDFSDVPSLPMAFTNNNINLRGRINGLTADGETALFDATYEAIAALEAERPPGKRAVVALTDGVDNSSRRRVDEVIARAREAKIPLYMLGFGRDRELDMEVMKRMARETGGKFFHAKDAESLMNTFEKLANDLHDDGIDEAALKQLAEQTGGQYFHAGDVDQMKLILETVATTIGQKEYQVTFQSQFGDTGTQINYALKLVSRTGAEVGGTPTGDDFQVVDVVKARDVRHGLVVASVNHFVYLFFLLLFGFLLVLPAGLRRLTRSEN
jgi:Mg-chelatase subunit ChlD